MAATDMASPPIFLCFPRALSGCTEETKVFVDPMCLKEFELDLTVKENKTYMMHIFPHCCRSEQCAIVSPPEDSVVVAVVLRIFRQANFQVFSEAFLGKIGEQVQTIVV